MTTADLVRLALGAVTANRVRLFLILLAVTLGVAAVIMLTALGEGARRYVTDQFRSLGTNLLIVMPGRNETTGGAPPLMGTTPRDLTLDDALALYRIPAAAEVAPISPGLLEVSWQERSRDVMVVGSTAALRRTRDLNLAAGRFLPDDDPRNPQAVCVIGDELRRELFGNRPAIGEWLRVEDRRFRVVGVLEARGRAFDLDWNDMVIIPIASAQMVFDTNTVFRIIVRGRDKESLPQLREAIIRIIKARHDGEDDITVLSQDTLVSTFDRILGALTLGIAGIAAISLAVAGVLIMNVMLVSVSQRTSEVGLLKALGASRREILRLFLTEALLLSGAGAVIGTLLGVSASALARVLYPDFNMVPPLWAVGGSVLVALCCGLLFGVLPARRAAALDPVVALTRGH